MPELDLEAIEHRSDRFLARLAGNQEGSTSLAAQMSAMDVPDLLAAAKDLRATPNRPHRLACETGDEKRLYTTDGKVYVYRQIGWHGQTGAFYALGEDPSKSEPGSFSPLWICVEVEAFNPEELGGDVPVSSAPAAAETPRSPHRCPDCGGPTEYQRFSGGREFYCRPCDNHGMYPEGAAPPRLQMLADGKFDELRQEMRAEIVKRKAGGAASVASTDTTTGDPNG